jgi:hypothetical protein
MAFINHKNFIKQVVRALVRLVDGDGAGLSKQVRLEMQGLAEPTAFADTRPRVALSQHWKGALANVASAMVTRFRSPPILTIRIS